MATPSIPIETIAAANRAIEAGATLTEAAKRLGISRRALCNARARAKALARGAALTAAPASLDASDGAPSWTGLETSADITAARSWIAQALLGRRITPAVGGTLTRLVADAARSVPPPSEERDLVDRDEVLCLLRGILASLWGDPARERVLEQIRMRAPALTPAPSPPSATPPNAATPPQPTEAAVERAEVAPPTPPSPAPPPRAPAVEVAPPTPPVAGPLLLRCNGCGRMSSRAHAVVCGR